MVFELVGAGNVALVTDSMAATGLPTATTRSGPARRGGARRRGGAEEQRRPRRRQATLLEVVRRTIGAGVSPADAVKSATLVPARILGLEDEIGSLKAGMRADIVAVDADFGLAAVLRGGQPWPAPPPEPGLDAVVHGGRTSLTFGRNHDAMMADVALCDRLCRTCRHCWEIEDSATKWMLPPPATVAEPKNVFVTNKDHQDRLRDLASMTRSNHPQRARC